MLRKFIKKQKLLFYLFCLSLMAALLINFPLSRIPEKVKYGYELGRFVYDISIGYIVAYIFFYLVVFSKEEKDRRNVNYRASLQTRFILIEGYNLYFHVMGHLTRSKAFPPSSEDIHKACLEIDPFNSPMMSTGTNSINLSWKVYLQLFHKTNTEYIDKIISLSYIDSELFGLMVKFEDSRLFFEAERRIFPAQKTESFYDGTFMEDAIKEYFDLIKQLKIYVDRNFDEYLQHSKLVEERVKQVSEFYN
jgi:hypothetical protein